MTNEFKIGDGPKSEVWVKKRVTCPQGVVCPTPDKHTMKVDVIGGTADPATFPAARWSDMEIVVGLTGTSVVLSSLYYEVTEPFQPPPPGLALVTIADPGCKRSIRLGEIKTCNFTNEYRASSPHNTAGNITTGNTTETETKTIFP